MISRVLNANEPLFDIIFPNYMHSRTLFVKLNQTILCWKILYALLKSFSFHNENNHFELRLNFSIYVLWRLTREWFYCLSVNSKKILFIIERQIYFFLLLIINIGTVCNLITKETAIVVCYLVAKENQLKKIFLKKIILNQTFCLTKHAFILLKNHISL